MKRAISLLALALISWTAHAASPAEDVRKLSDPKKAQGALEELVKAGAAAVPALVGEAIEGKDLEARGWAIAGLAEIGGAEAEKALGKLKDDPKAPALVRTWAAAGLLRAAKDIAALVALAPLVQQYPALQRPFSMRIEQLARSTKDAESLIKLAATNWQLQQTLAEPILASGAESLIAAMTRSSDMTVRQQAASYLGALAQRQGKAGNELVGDAVVKAYAFDPKAKDVPWAGGPLYVPNIGWDKTFALKLTRNLVAWHVWSDTNGRAEEKQKIDQNLNSIALSQIVGYSMSWGATTEQWLVTWGRAAGKKEVRALLEKQGLEKEPKYRRVLDSI